MHLSGFFQVWFTLFVLFFALYQEPLLKIEINHPALLAGNWSQLCTTCKVPLVADFIQIIDYFQDLFLFICLSYDNLLILFSFAFRL